MLEIRREEPGDQAGVRGVEEQAFGGTDEAAIVDSLRRRKKVMLSLVAVEGSQVVGHIVFSPVTIDGHGASFEAVGLGPMAVMPGRQREGIGSRLVGAGLEECRKSGHDLVIVLGHPEYYPRFGFRPAVPLGIRWEHDLPEGVFMLIELEPGALAGRRGVVHYQPEFDR